jgi:hypothetical protein
MSHFGLNSTNPRLRRAFAHTQLNNFRNGKASFEEARQAVDAASNTRKGQKSHFEAAIIKAAIDPSLKNPVVFIDWAGISHVRSERSAFGGYVMSYEEALVWEQLHQAAVDAGEDETEPYEAYNEIFDEGYPSATLTTSPDQNDNFTWGKAYSLSKNPARALLEELDIRN